MRTATHSLIGIIVGVTILGSASPSSATPLACEREISKGLAKFTQAKIKALSRCRDAVIAGKFAGPCPDAKTATVTCAGSCDRQALIAALEQRGYGGKVQ